MSDKVDIYIYIQSFENAVIKVAEQSQLPPIIVSKILENLALKIEQQARQLSLRYQNQSRMAAKVEKEEVVTHERNGMVYQKKRIESDREVRPENPPHNKKGGSS